MLLNKIVNNLDREKYIPVVVGIRNIGPYYDILREKNVEVYTLNVNHKYNIYLPLRLFMLLKKIKPDLLHTHLFHANIVGRVLGCFLNIKVISHLHNTLHYSFFRKLLLKYTDRLVSKTVAVCNKTLEVVTDNNIIPENKIEIINNGIVLDDFDEVLTTGEQLALKEELDIKPGKKVLVAVGRLESPKGYHYLLQVIERVRGKIPEIVLIIAGAGELLSELEQQIEERKLVPNIKMIGQRNDISKLLQISDLFVMSSLWEGLPMALLEAMASSLPVVATDVGGISEVVQEGVNGFLVPPARPELMADAVMKILKLEDTKRKEMGRKGRNIIEEHYDIKKLMAEYENLYDSIVGG